MEEWIKVAEKVSGLKISEHQAEQFALYEAELLDWNTKVNLTSVRDSNGVRLKHFADSLACAAACGDLNGRSLIDVGTGAGFPGIPLKIMFPEMRLVLSDSVGKKTTFCQHIIDRLELKNCEVITTRAEALGADKNYREKFDVAAARAVAHLPILCEYLLPLVKIGGIMLAQKGATAPDELHESTPALKALGGDAGELLPADIPGLDDKRYIITINKIKKTPGGYPRRVGLPQKKPIGS